MAKSVIDRCRTGIPGVKGLSRVTNEAEWGARTASERYHYGTQTFPPPADRHAPEAPAYKQGPGYANIANPNSWIRGGGKNAAEGKPNFDHRGKGKR